MKKYLFFAAALLGLVACNNNEPQNVTPRKVVLHATVENGGAANGPHRIAPVDPTAATVTFAWEADDQVIVKTNAGNYTLDATDINGNDANFEGEVAGDLTSYTVYYGYNPDAASQSIPYVAGSFKPCVKGTGANDNFTLNQFYPVLKLQLKGAVTLGKIEYLIGADVKATMTITDGFALTSTASVVYLPVADVASTGFSLKFYDNAATPALIMEKATTFNLADKMGKIVTMPEVEVQAGSETTGTAKRTGNVDVTWVQLWANGPKFAKYNVGVTDGKEESYGGYYCWGSSIDKDQSAAHKSGTDALTGDDDTATNLWGNNWRMPTQAELDDLLTNCDVAWTTVNGVNGRKFTGKGDYASNFVFLPAAGCCVFGPVDDQGDYGYYWSSTPNGSFVAYRLRFFSGIQDVDGGNRIFGYSVRAVYDPSLE